MHYSIFAKCGLWQQQLAITNYLLVQLIDYFHIFSLQIFIYFVNVYEFYSDTQLLAIA